MISLIVLLAKLIFATKLYLSMNVVLLIQNLYFSTQKLLENTNLTFMRFVFSDDNTKVYFRMNDNTKLYFRLFVFYYLNNA